MFLHVIHKSGNFVAEIYIFFNGDSSNQEIMLVIDDFISNSWFGKNHEGTLQVGKGIQETFSNLDKTQTESPLSAKNSSRKYF